MAQASLKPWLLGGAALAGFLYFIRGEDQPEEDEDEDDRDRPTIVPDDDPGPGPQDNLLPHVTPDDPDMNPDFKRVFTRTTQGVTFKVLKVDDGGLYRSYIWISSDQKWGAVHPEGIFESLELASSVTEAIDDAEERIKLHVDNGGQVLHKGLWDPEGFS